MPGLLQKYLLKRLHTHDSVSLNHRNIYILPTREGFIFAIILFFMFLAAVNFNNNLIYISTFLLAALAILSMFETQKSLQGIRLQSARAKGIFAGETAQVPLQLVLPRPPALPLQLSLSYNEGHFQQIKLYGKDQAELIVPVKGQKRGYLKLPVMTLATTFPFGLFRAWSHFKLSNQTVVYPEPQACEQLFFESHNSSTNSDVISATKTGSDDFAGLDKFVYGQSLKKVHWKAVAKHQQWYSKQYLKQQNDHKILLDIEQLSAVPGFEKKLSCLCYLLLQAQAGGYEYALKLYQQQSDMNYGDKHLQNCLQMLALVDSKIFQDMGDTQ